MSSGVPWEDEQGRVEENRRGETVEVGRPMTGLLQVLREQ